MQSLQKLTYQTIAYHVVQQGRKLIAGYGVDMRKHTRDTKVKKCLHQLLLILFEESHFLSNITSFYFSKICLPLKGKSKQEQICRTSFPCPLLTFSHYEEALTYGFPMETCSARKKCQLQGVIRCLLYLPMGNQCKRKQKYQTQF